MMLYKNSGNTTVASGAISLRHLVTKDRKGPIWVGIRADRRTNIESYMDAQYETKFYMGRRHSCKTWPRKVWNYSCNGKLDVKAPINAADGRTLIFHKRVMSVEDEKQLVPHEHRVKELMIITFMMKTLHCMRQRNERQSSKVSRRQHFSMVVTLTMLNWWVHNWTVKM